MKFRPAFVMSLILVLALFQLGMSRNRNQYDEELRQEEKAAGRSKMSAKNPVSGIARGVKEVTVDSTAGFVSETAEGSREEGPIVGTLEGARRGTGAILDSTVKGALRVATLGQGDVENYEVREPEANSGEPTKVTIKIPGT